MGRRAGCGAHIARTRSPAKVSACAVTCTGWRRMRGTWSARSVGRRESAARRRQKPRRCGTFESSPPGRSAPRRYAGFRPAGGRQPPKRCRAKPSPVPWPRLGAEANACFPRIPRGLPLRRPAGLRPRPARPGGQAPSHWESTLCRPLPAARAARERGCPKAPAANPAAKVRAARFGRSIPPPLRHRQGARPGRNCGRDSRETQRPDGRSGGAPQRKEITACCAGKNQHKINDKQCFRRYPGPPAGSRKTVSW